MGTVADTVLRTVVAMRFEVVSSAAAVPEDFDGLRNGSHSERDGEFCGAAGFDDHLIDNHGAEALGGDGDGIAAGQQVGNQVSAFGSGDGGEGQAG